MKVPLLRSVGAANMPAAKALRPGRGENVLLRTQEGPVYSELLPAPRPVSVRA